MVRTRAVHDSGRPTTHALLCLARARVFKRLDRAVEFPIVIVCAPSGFGKSTVLREYIEQRRLPHRRLNLTPKHADLLGFLRGLAACVADVAPALLNSFMGVYDRMNASEDAPRQIATWAAEHLGSLDLILMIDGLEYVRDARLFVLLTELIDCTSSARVRWVVLSQSVVELPIARWLANARMDLPIDDFDLVLTSADLTHAFDSAGASISNSISRALVVSAGDLPAIVALVLSNLAAVGDGHLPFERPYSYEQAAHIAFAARSLREQHFLLETCLYTSFDKRLLAIAGWTEIDALLDELIQSAAFVYRQPDGAYCYHDSFRYYLEARLRTNSEDSYLRTATATASVFRDVGRWSDALELYTEMRAVAPLAQLLSERGFELMDRGEADVVFNALTPLGDDEFAAYPVALALKASLESLHGSFDVAEAWFRHAIKTVGDASQLDAIVFRFATDLVRRDRRDAIDVLQPIVDRGGHDVSLAVSIAGLLATAYATHHMNVEAAQAIGQALSRICEVDDTAVRAKVYFQAGYVALFARDPVRARSYAQHALDTALASHLHDIAARALSILYNVAMDYEDDITATRGYLEHLAACSIKAGSRYLLMYATLGLYEIEVLCGNLIESARLDEKLQTLEVDYSVIATETLLPAQALRATWSGDFHRAYRLVAGTAEKQITAIRQAQRYAEIAVYAAAAGLRGEAALAASRALATAPKVERDDKAAAFTKMYVALALTMLGRRARARQILLKLRRRKRLSARLEHLANAVRTINERWTRGRYSVELRTVLDRLDASAFGGIARLIEALPLPETFRGKFTQLTSTERDMLVHMSAGLTGLEIASLSGQNQEAVDSQIGSLCRKLGCSSPRHAVALANSINALRTVSLHVS